MATQRRITTAALVAALAALAIVAAPATATPPATSSGVPADLELVVTKHSILGDHVWYRQTYQGLPVLDTYYARHLDQSGAVTSIDDGRRSVPSILSTTPSIAADTATSVATKAIAARAARPDKDHATLQPPTESTATLAVQGGPAARLVWSVLSDSPSGTIRTVVDAHSGTALSVKSLAHNVEGTGRVFNPNPVVTLRDESLKDNNDANQQKLTPAYKTVALHHLNGNGKLQGQYAKVIRAGGGLATSDAESFVYQRQNDKFEQVMAYYQVSRTQVYIHALGQYDINNEAQQLETNTFSDDNSYYDAGTDTISFGSGGVDDAEDAEVIWHEYGHAIQDDQVPGFGSSSQAGAIGEGFGDYWAVTMSVPVSGGFVLPCVMDWDATSYTTTTPHCLRRVDTDKTTDDIEGEVHADGEIWSAALWAIHGKLGRDRANKVILESQFNYTPGTTFAAAAQKVVAAARALYGDPAATACTQAFQARKIL